MDGIQVFAAKLPRMGRSWIMEFWVKYSQTRAYSNDLNRSIGTISLSHGHLRHSFDFFSMVWGGFEHPFSLKIRFLFPCWPRYPDVSAEAPLLWFHWPLWFRTGSHAGFLQVGTCRDSHEIKSRCHRNCAEASWQIQKKSSFAECLHPILCFSSRVGFNKNEHVQFGFSDFSASWCDFNVLYKSLSLRSCVADATCFFWQGTPSDSFSVFYLATQRPFCWRVRTAQHDRADTPQRWKTRNLRLGLWNPKSQVGSAQM